MAQNPALAAGAPDAFARHPKEMTRFYICLAFSAIVYTALALLLMWLAITAPLALIPILIVAAGIWLMVIIGEAFFVAHVRGNGLKVSETQLPHVCACAHHAAEVLGIPMPEVYVVQFGRVREAIVRLFVRSRILVISSALVEDCGNGPELDMAVSVELARFKFHHLAWKFWLFPAMVLPIIYPAYRRATQYTADRCGMQVCGDWQAARRAIFILAAGGRQGRKVNPDAYAGQVAASGGFWMTIRHLMSGHPALSWRASELLQAVPEMQNAAPVPQRSIPATILCLFVPGGVTQIRPVGGGLGGLLIMVAVVAMLVGGQHAIAVPCPADVLRRPHRPPAADQHGLGPGSRISEQHSGWPGWTEDLVFAGGGRDENVICWRAEAGSHAASRRPAARYAYLLCSLPRRAEAPGGLRGRRDARGVAGRVRRHAGAKRRGHP
jgi:hypothetical protein